MTDLNNIVYHWTDAEEFAQFSSDFLGQNTDDNASSEAWAQTAHLGFWFNCGGECEGIRKAACRLNIENPYHVDCLESLANYFELTEDTAEGLREKLSEQGYDGIIVDCDEEFGGESYVAFCAEQIEIVEWIMC